MTQPMCWKRLDGCGAESELIDLVKDCLAVEPEDRPRDAKVVADRITAYLAGVQERVQAAERERAVAVARAVEERRRRKVQLALAAAVLALTTLGGLSMTYYLQQRQAQAAAAQRAIDQVTMLQQQALAQPEDIERWEIALAAVEQADPAGDPQHQSPARRLCKDRSGRGSTRPSATRSCSIAWSTSAPPRPTTWTAQSPTTPMPKPSAGRDRPGQAAAGQGGGQDQGPAGIRGHGTRRGTR